MLVGNGSKRSKYLLTSVTIRCHCSLFCYKCCKMFNFFSVSQPRRGFHVIPTPKNSKHTHPIVVFGKNKYFYKRQTQNKVAYQCSYKKYEGGTKRKVVTESCKHVIYIGLECKQLVNVKGVTLQNHEIEQLLKQQHTISHIGTFTNYNHLQIWCRRFLSSLLPLTNKASTTFYSFQRLFPIKSLIYYGYNNIRSYLYRQRASNYPKLPVSPSDLWTKLKTSVYGCNYYLRQFKQSISLLKNAPPPRYEKMYTDINNTNSAAVLQQQLSYVNNEINEYQKMQKILVSKLVHITAPEYYHSTMYFATDNNHQVLWIGSFHGAIRLCKKISGKCFVVHTWFFFCLFVVWFFFCLFFVIFFVHSLFFF